MMIDSSDDYVRKVSWRDVQLTNILVCFDSLLVSPISKLLSPSLRYMLI